MSEEIGKLYTCDVCGIRLFCKKLPATDIPSQLNSWEPDSFENENSWYHGKTKVFKCENSFLDVCPTCLHKLSTLIDHEVVKIRKEASIYDKRVYDLPASE